MTLLLHQSGRFQVGLPPSVGMVAVGLLLRNAPGQVLKVGLLNLVQGAANSIQSF